MIVRSPAIVVATVALLLSSACANTDNGTPDVLPSTSPMASISSSPTPAPSEQPALSGIICLCTDTPHEEAALLVIDPATGEPTGSRSFQFPPQTESFFVGGTHVTRRYFDQSFTRLAVQISGFADGSIHAGYLEAHGLNTVELIDLTGKRATDDFASAPRDRHPVFTPDDRMALWSEVEDAVMEIDFETGELRPWNGDVLPVGTGGLDVLIGPNDWLIPVGGAALPYVPNPSGTVATDGRRVYERSPNGDEEPLALDSSPCGIVTAWVDDETFVCNDGEIFLVRFELSSGEAEARQLTPETDRVNRSAIVSPAGDEIAFISEQGGTAGIFRVAITGGTPTKLSDVPTGAVLLEWTE